MTFLLPLDLVDEKDRPGFQASQRGARSAGSPFLSFYTPTEMLAVARDAGFQDTRHVSGTVLSERYFAERGDDLHPSSGEDILVAIT